MSRVDGPAGIHSTSPELDRRDWEERHVLVPRQKH